MDRVSGPSTFVTAGSEVDVPSHPTPTATANSRSPVILAYPRKQPYIKTEARHQLRVPDQTSPSVNYFTVPENHKESLACLVSIICIRQN